MLGPSNGGEPVFIEGSRTRLNLFIEEVFSMENKSSRDVAEQTIAEWQLAILKGITQAAFAESMGLSTNRKNDRPNCRGKERL